MKGQGRIYDVRKGTLGLSPECGTWEKKAHYVETWEKTLKGAVPGREQTPDSKEDLEGNAGNS